MSHSAAARLDSSYSKHWATLLSPSPSPELPSSRSSNASLTTSPASAGPSRSDSAPLSLTTNITPWVYFDQLTDRIGQGGISLPPLHTAVPLAKLDTYRRPKDTSVSPIQEMLFRKSPTSAAHHENAILSFQRDRVGISRLPRDFNPRQHHLVPTPGAGGGRPVLSRLTTDLYSATSHSHSLKSPRKRADQGQLNVLNRAFGRSSYPSTKERDRLSKKLGMTSRSVQIWFQNKRRSVKVQEESSQERYTGGTR